jgi:hypothetical protein
MEDITIVNIGKLVVHKDFNTYPLYNVVWKLSKDNKSLFIELNTASDLVKDSYAWGALYEIDLNITALRNSCNDFAKGLNEFIRLHIARHISQFLPENKDEANIEVSLVNLLINESSNLCRPDQDLWFRYHISKDDVKLTSSSLTRNHYRDLEKVITKVLSNTKIFGSKYNLFHLEFDQDDHPEYVDIVYDKTHILERRLINYTKYSDKFYPSLLSFGDVVCSTEGALLSNDWEGLINHIVSKLRTKLTTDYNSIHEIHSHINHFRTILKNTCQCRNSAGTSISAIFDQVEIINELFQKVSS